MSLGISALDITEPRPLALPSVVILDSQSVKTTERDRKLARELKRRHGWRLHITKRRQRAFKVVGLTWIRGAHVCVALAEIVA